MSRLPPIAVITGMHRSGTSVVARMASICGLDLGPPDDLMSGKKDNPDGFFESLSATRLNDDMLAHLGGSWRDPRRFTLDDSDAQASKIVESARLLVEERANGGVWGVKDPRLSLLLPLWGRIASISGVVHCVRNPSEVAGSLQQREGMGPEEAARMWLIYSLSVVAWAPEPVTIVYRDLLNDPASSVDRVIGALGLNPTDDQRADAISVVSPRANHNGKATVVSGPLMATAIEAFEAIGHGSLKQATAGAIVDGLFSAQELAAASETLASQEEGYERAIASLEKQMRDANETLGLQIDTTEAERDAARATLNERDIELAAAEARRVEVTQHLDRSERNRTELGSQVSELSTELIAANSRLSEAENREQRIMERRLIERIANRPPSGESRG